MDVTALQTHVRFITNTDTATFTDAEILTLLNIEYGHRILDILRIQVDRNANQKEAITDLLSTSGLVTNNLGYNGEYPFPLDLVRPIRAEVSYDGSTWRPCTIYDINDNDTSEHEETAQEANFSQTSPYIRFDRDSYFIRPPKTTAGDVTGGIHIWYEYRETDLTSGSPTFDESLHNLLAYDVAEIYAIKRPNSYDNVWMNRLLMKKDSVEKKFEEFYRGRFKKQITLTPQHEDFS